MGSSLKYLSFALIDLYELGFSFDFQFKLTLLILLSLETLVLTYAPSVLRVSAKVGVCNVVITTLSSSLSSLLML